MYQILIPQMLVHSLWRQVCFKIETHNSRATLKSVLQTASTLVRKRTFCCPHSNGKNILSLSASLQPPLERILGVYIEYSYSSRNVHPR
jgi:hypothetical protein